MPTDKEIEISKNLFDDLLREERKLIDSEMNLKQNGKQIVEAKIIKTKADGYELADPLGQKCKNVELSMFISIADKKFLNKVEDIILKYIHVKKVIFHSFFLAYYYVITDVYPHNKSFILADIRGETTDVSVVHDGLLLKTISYPYGKNSIERKIMHVLRIPKQIAESYLRMHTDKKVDPQIASKLELVLDDAKKEWFIRFTQAVSEICKSNFLPGKLFIVSDKDFHSLFANEKNKELDLIGALKKISPIFVDDKNISHFCLFNEKVPYEPFLAVENIYFNKIFHTQD